MAETQPAPRQATTRDFLAVVFRQLWVILTVFMISVVSVLVISWRSPTTYESSSRVLVSRGRKQSVLAPNLQVLTWEEEVSSEIETVKSYPVAQRTQKILDQWYAEKQIPRPLKLATSGVDAGVIGESNVIEISYTSRDRESCVPVTKALTLAYMDFRQASATVPFVNEFFTREIASVDSAVTALMARRDAYYRSTGVIDPTEERHELFGLLQSTEGDIARIEQDIRTQQQNLRQAELIVASPDLPNPAFFAGLELGNASILNNLQQRYNQLQQDREALLPVQTAEHPQLKGVNLALAEVQAQIRAEVKASIDLMRSKLASLEQKERTLLDQARGLRGQLEVIPDRESSLDQLDHELATLRDRYKELVGKEIQARISQATSPDWTVTLFAWPTSPRAMKTTDYVRLALAPILSLIVGLMLAFFLDSLDHSIKSGSDVEEYLDVPVLASLPDSRG